MTLEISLPDHRSTQSAETAPAHAPTVRVLVETADGTQQWCLGFLLGEVFGKNGGSSSRQYRVHFGQVEEALVIPEERIDLLSPAPAPAEISAEYVHETALPYDFAECHPLERLWRFGQDALSDEELIALLLRDGRPGITALEIAREVRSKVADLAGLAQLDAAAIQDLGEANAAALIAAVELSKRLARAKMSRRELLDRPEVIASYLTLRYGSRDQEIMGALYLDTRNRLIAEREIFRGTLSRAAVEPRAILKEGLLRSAPGFILFHTHPSGDPSPSPEDMTFTRRLAEAGELLGVHLLDHMILGGGHWVSLGRRGAW